jgi:hypothetical protein
MSCVLNHAICFLVFRVCAAVYETFRFLVVKQTPETANREPCILDEMPDVCLRRVASFLGPDDVLARLLVAHPELAPRLHHSCPWPSRVNNNRLTTALDWLRFLLLGEADATDLSVLCRPDSEPLSRKLGGLLASDKLKSLRVKSPRYIAGSRLSRSITDLKFRVLAEDADGRDPFELLSSQDLQLPALKHLTLAFKIRDDSGRAFQTCTRLCEIIPGVESLTLQPTSFEELWDTLPARFYQSVKFLQMKGYTDLMCSSYPSIRRFSNVERLELIRAESAYTELVSNRATLPRLRALSVVDPRFDDDYLRQWACFGRRVPNLDELEIRNASLPMPMVDQHLFFCHLLPWYFPRLRSVVIDDVDMINPLLVILMVSRYSQDHPNTLRDVRCEVSFRRRDELPREQVDHIERSLDQLRSRDARYNVGFSWVDERCIFTFNSGGE